VPASARPGDAISSAANAVPRSDDVFMEVPPFDQDQKP
jgi:hypothetical protein